MSSQLEKNQRRDTENCSNKNLIILCPKNHKPMATRKSSQIVMTEFGKSMPELIEGSADLKGSNLSYYDDMDSFSIQILQENIFTMVSENLVCQPYQMASSCMEHQDHSQVLF